MASLARLLVELEGHGVVSYRTLQTSFVSEIPPGVLACLLFVEGTPLPEAKMTFVILL